MKSVYLNAKYFRPRTSHTPVHVNYIVAGGGLGDYINHCAALEWIARECPHVMGHIFVNPPFLDVAKYIFKKYPRFKVSDLRDVDARLIEGSLIVNHRKSPQLIQATGAHLLDLGFMYFAQLDKPMPGYNRLPTIDYNGPWKWPDLKEDSKYAVFTPGATADTRAMPAKHFNTLVNYTADLGITPVFLGKKEFSTTKASIEAGYTAKFNEDNDYSRGIDLREKTSLLEAVQIMRRARFVIGIDNGLLHFAGTTETPIIFGHTVATVEHRKIRRPKGLTIDIAVDEKTLPCIGCQSRMRFIAGHKFSRCIYDDYACLELLFADDCATWKKAIDHVA